MLRHFRTAVTLLIFGVGPLLIGGAQPLHAQQYDTQRAYDAGLQNGTHDRDQGKSMNLKTDNWRGLNLEAYREGYEQGFSGTEKTGKPTSAAIVRGMKNTED